MYEPAGTLSTAFMICCIRISWSARFEEFGRLKNAPVGGNDNGGAGALACAGGAMTTPSARTASATTTRTSFFMKS